MEDDNEEIVYDELIQNEEDHKKESARLLELISQRKEMVELFKVAKPERFAELREAISGLDKSIESTENVIELLEDLIQKRRDYIETLKETSIMAEKILKGMREHFADDPEKLARIEAMLEDDGKSH